MQLTGKRGAWLSLPLFFGLLLNGLSGAEKSGDCRFSLKEEIPKNIKFTVQAGRIAFLCKTETFFLRGTVTRTLEWQLTGRIFETMAEKTKAETLEKWPSGRLYKISSEKESGKTIICGYHSREPYSLELCAPELQSGSGVEASSYARTLVQEILEEFKKLSPENSPLLRSAPLYSQKKVFTEENDTREPALLSLTMPPGYVEVTRRENRALFTDAAGLAEMEMFYEISDLSLDSELAHRVYKKSIAGFLTKQGQWQSDKGKEVEKKGDVTCLVFTDNDKRLSHYCYTVVGLTQAGKQRYCRVAFVVAYLREAVDRSKLLAEQQAMLNAWAAMLRQHAN